MRIGKQFWIKAADGFLRQARIFDDPSNSYIFENLDGKAQMDSRLFVQVNGLAYDSDDLLRLMCFKGSKEERRCERYLELLKSLLLPVSIEDLAQLPGDTPLNVMQALEAGYVLGRIMDMPLATRCIELAIKMWPSLLARDRDCTLGRPPSSKLGYSDITYGGRMMMWWLLNDKVGLADDLWNTRLQKVPNALKKEASYLYMRYMGGLSQYAIHRAPKQTAEVERALLDVQLFWLRCLGIDRTCEVRMSQMVVAELLYNDITTDQTMSVQEAFERLKPDWIKMRYDRIEGNPISTPVRDDENSGQTAYRINESDGNARKLDQERFIAAKARQPVFVPYYDLRHDKKALAALSKVVLGHGQLSALQTCPQRNSWEAHFKALAIPYGIFTGYVRRVLQEKDGTYTVELKTIDQVTYDHEHGWYAMGAVKHNIGSGLALGGNVSEAFLPGRLLRILYTVGSREKVMDDLVVEHKIECEVSIETNYPTTMS